MRVKLILGAALLLANASPALAQECVGWGEPVELSGILVEGVYPGPPEYESVAKGDAAYTALMLHLRVPICVREGENAEMVPHISATDLVQLACDKKEIARLKKGELTHVRGTLFVSHSGYHVTQAVLECD
jgi:hypothetical protein